MDAPMPEMPRWWSDRAVSDLLTPVDRVVPVLGAGVSRGAGLPDGGQLATWLAGNVPTIAPSTPGASLFAVVDSIDLARMPANELRQIVAAHIESFELRPTPLLAQLVQLPSRFIITLNYDDLVGHTAEQNGVPVRRLCALNRDDLIEAHRRLTVKDGSPPSELTIFHLHGHVSQPETLVLDDAAYRELAGHPVLEQMVFTLTHFRSLAFAGTALDENYLLTMLQKQINGAFHVLFCHEDELQELTTGRAALSSRHRLRVVGYPDHGELVWLPRWVTASQPAREESAAAATLDPKAAPAAADYILSEFDVPGMEGSTVSEGDIRDGQRTVVVGGAGSGKTHLLSWLAANAADERPAVRIRLADVTLRPGTPEQVLAEWASHARSAPSSSVDVSSTALRADRLHFLLDGLDEVANERQPTAVSLIAHVAERYPQHAFTLTSRPMPALATLGFGQPAGTTPWRIVELVPGAVWQQRYLGARGITLGHLEARLPALNDMRELLHIPFFLTRTVELFDNGMLEGLRDIGDLLGRLVDFALSREEELLPMVDLAVARAWLKRVALAATIAGRRTFTFAELQEVPVAEDLVGDLHDLVQQLQLRLLLTEEDLRLRFSHRLLTDELAAEALAEMEPSEELLDSLVPRVADELAGVRDDVAITVNLLCLRSSRWREAVARRDPLAAARATPIDGDLAERTAAVDLLWATYEKWGIWIWDRAMPDLLEDAEVLARLLQQDPNGAAVARLRRLLHTGDEIQQGNAVQVLASVSPTGFVDDLRAVLADPTRFEVVTRQAMTAAADLLLTELVDDIVGAMLAAPESTVHQDGSLALRDLTPDDRLLDVAMRLVPCREGNFFAASVRKRMSASDRIELAKALAVARVDVLAEDRADLAAAASEVDPTATIVQAVACAAVLWSDQSEEVKALLDRDPCAAAQGLLEAREHGADWWELVRLASHADLDILRAADANPRIIEAAERDLEWRGMSPEQQDAVRRAIEQEWAESRRARGIEHPEPPRLVKLLRLPASESDTTLQQEALQLRNQVDALEAQDLDELRSRLAAWWPSDEFTNHLTVRDGGFSLSDRAAAWLFLAPPAAMPVNDDQWTQLAAQPLATTELSDWLQPQATEHRMRYALRLMTDNCARAWRRVIACFPVPLPEFVVEACAAEAASDPERPEETVDLVQRLVAGGVTDPVRAWAARDEVAAQALRPTLAAHGEIHAQRRLVDELLTDVRAGRAPSRDELGWMSNLRRTEFLAALFDILERTYPPIGDGPRRGSMPQDVIAPTIDAIERIGTREAVRLYDELLARGGTLRWLRGQRDRIAAEVLRVEGAAASGGAAEAAGVPRFAAGG